VAKVDKCLQFAAAARRVAVPVGYRWVVTKAVGSQLEFSYDGCDGDSAGEAWATAVGTARERSVEPLLVPGCLDFAAGPSRGCRGWTVGAGGCGGTVRGGAVRGVADGAATLLSRAHAAKVGGGGAEAEVAARGAWDGAGGGVGAVFRVWHRLLSGAGPLLAHDELAGGAGVLRGDLDGVGLFEG
jgi:hypothetical protein